MEMQNGISSLAGELAKLPGIGQKSAQRLAYHIVEMPQEAVERLAAALVGTRSSIRYCAGCCTFSTDELCPVCADPERDISTIMVVETPQDMEAYERTGKYRGVYHVLHGAISPALGIGPSDIRIRELMQKLQKRDCAEVIIATNPTLEGEATAMYLVRLIKPAGIKVSRIASGVPVGGDLEYIDEITLMRALEGRVEL